MPVLARTSSNLTDDRTVGSILNMLRRGIVTMIVIIGMMQTKITLVTNFRDLLKSA
jgi:hypothetical protein